MISTVALTLFGPVALLLALVAFGATFFAVQALWRYVSEYGNHAYKHIPAVKHQAGLAQTLFLGDFGDIKAADPGTQHVKWMNELGGVYRYRHMFYVQRLLVADPRAMMHILNKSSNYPKPDHTTVFLQAVLGNGLVTIDGDAHRRQRKVVAPAFSPQAVRELQPLMDKHAARLERKITETIRSMCASRKDAKSASGNGTLVPGEARSDGGVRLPESATAKGPTAVVDVLFWLSRTTLDIIGETGFNHEFNSLEQGSGKPSELHTAIHELLSSIMDVDLFQAITILLSENPGLHWLRRLPTRRNKALWSSQKILNAEALRIVNEAKKDVAAEMNATSLKEGLSLEELESSQSTRLANRALMWRLIKANMATDLKPSEKMSDDELLGQMTTLIFAGHETTATQTSWALHLLGKNPEMQEKLRKEVLAARRPATPEEEDIVKEGDDKTQYRFDGINDLPYLDAVCREAIRLLPSIPSTVRTVRQDDVVPLSKPYPRADGKGTFDSILLPKGHELFIPIGPIQQSQDIWGPDATEFKPERWLDLEDSVHGAKLPGHTLAFIAGARSCVGQRLAVQEVKVLLAHLVSSLAFEPVGEYQLNQKQSIVRRALVQGHEKDGTRLPLVVAKLN